MMPGRTNNEAFGQFGAAKAACDIVWFQSKTQSGKYSSIVELFTAFEMQALRPLHDGGRGARGPVNCRPS